MRPKIHLPPQRPLDALECERIWRWERRMILFYSGAMVALCLAVFFLAYFGSESWARQAVIAFVGILVVAGGIVQFRERCPRCRTLLGRQARVLLPLKCASCGVIFPRRQDGVPDA